MGMRRRLAARVEAAAGMDVCVGLSAYVAIGHQREGVNGPAAKGCDQQYASGGIDRAMARHFGRRPLPEQRKRAVLADPKCAHTAARPAFEFANLIDTVDNPSTRVRRYPAGLWRRGHADRRPTESIAAE